jgi:hypothetical protein
MYCQSCGTEATEGIRYCKRCGTSLNSTDERIAVPMQPPKLLLIVFILALLTFGCMAVLLAFAGAEAHELTERALTFIVIFGLATIFGVDALLIRFLTTMFGLPTTSLHLDRGRKEFQVSRAVPPSRVPELEPGHPTMPSVTEHTTRSFDRPGSKSTY